MGSDPGCQVPNLSNHLKQHSIFITDGDDVLVVCGEIYSPDQSLVSRLCNSLEHGQWVFHSSMTKPRLEAVAVSTEIGVFIFGGDSKDDKTSEFLPKKSKTWIEGPNIPVGIRKACGVNLPETEEVFLIGGYHGNERNIIKYNYNLHNQGWSTVMTLPFRRTGHACTKSGNQLIVAGGMDDLGISIDKTEIINLVTLDVRIVGALKVPRSYFGLAAFSDGIQERILAFGGYDSSKDSGLEYLSSVEEWNMEEQTWQLLPDVSLKEGKSGFGFYEVSVDILCGMCL